MTFNTTLVMKYWLCWDSIISHACFYYMRHWMFIDQEFSRKTGARAFHGAINAVAMIGSRIDAFILIESSVTSVE
jgi:hypothetical protein